MSQFKEFLDVIIDVFAGSLAGCAGIVVGQPFDTIKVRQQIRPDLFPTAMACFQKTIKKEGTLSIAMYLTSE